MPLQKSPPLFALSAIFRLSQREDNSECSWSLWCSKFSVILSIRSLIQLLTLRDSFLVEDRTRHRKVASSNPGRSCGRIFFSRVNCVCWLLFGGRFIPVLLQQWHVKDPGHSAKSAGSGLHLNTHTPSTQRSRSGLTMPLSRHSDGTYLETSSHATSQGTFVHNLSHCGLFLA